MTKCHFWANVILRQPHVWGSRASPAQKSKDLILETFQGEHFLFDLVDRFLSYYGTNLKKKRSVIL